MVEEVVMEKYVPNIYTKDIFSIQYDALLEKGIFLVLFDLDNTLVPGHIKEATKEVKELFDSLKQKGFTVVIFSNSPKKRLKPFETYLEVKGNALSCKPLQRSFTKILSTYHVKPEEACIIGDQLLTDIVGGNRAGITTILIDPITVQDLFLTKYNRARENRIIRKLQKNNGFKRGTYYE